MTTTITCKVCGKDAGVLGHKGTGNSVVRCPHCTYVWTVPTEPDHPEFKQHERIQLRVEHGRLYFEDQMLMHFYEAGDVDTVPWPVRGKKAEKLLALALYDLRETESRIASNARVAILPSGREFHFDNVLAERGE